MIPPSEVMPSFAAPSFPVPARRDRWILILILLAALAVRVGFFPGRDILDIDEPYYQDSSLLLVEGLTPGYKAAPAGPQFWLGWSYAMAHAAWYTINPAVADRGAPLALRPLIAVNRALWESYRDYLPLRRFLLSCEIAVSLLGVWAAFRLGRAFAGLSGAVLLSSVVAFSPLYLSMSLMTRPYIMGWSFGLVAAYFAATARTQTRRRAAWVFAGLAIGSRIEMALILPMLWWLIFPNLGPRRRIRQLIGGLALTIMIMLLAAPWFLTSLVTNLKSIVAVKVMAVVHPHERTFLHLLWVLMAHEGLGIAFVGLMIGLIIALRSGRDTSRWICFAAICAVIAATSIKGTGFGLHHDGGAMVTLLAASAPAIGVLYQKRARIVSILAAIGVVISLGNGLFDRSWRQPAFPYEPASKWVEEHVAPGTIVYGHDYFPALLPTPEAADRSWQVLTVVGWHEKLRWGIHRIGLSAADDLPRALSFDNQSKEMIVARANFILGSRTNLPIPRFDLRVLPPDGVLTTDLANAYRQTGGVLMLSEDPNAPVPGKLIASWPAENGHTVRIFATDDVKLK